MAYNSNTNTGAGYDSRTTGEKVTDTIGLSNHDGRQGANTTHSGAYDNSGSGFTGNNNHSSGTGLTGNTHSGVGHSGVGSGNAYDDRTAAQKATDAVGITDHEGRYGQPQTGNTQSGFGGNNAQYGSTGGFGSGNTGLGSHGTHSGNSGLGNDGIGSGYGSGAQHSTGGLTGDRPSGSSGGVTSTGDNTYGSTGDNTYGSTGGLNRHDGNNTGPFGSNTDSGAYGSTGNGLAGNSGTSGLTGSHGSHGTHGTHDTTTGLTGSHGTSGTHGSHDTHDAHGTHGTHSSSNTTGDHKPSLGDKLAGTAEQIKGALTGNQAAKEEGKLRKQGVDTNTNNNY